MDSAPRRRGATALLNPDLDTAYEDRGLAIGHDAVRQPGPEEAAWVGDGCVSNSVADAAWLDAAGPGEGRPAQLGDWRRRRLHRFVASGDLAGVSRRHCVRQRRNSGLGPAQGWRESARRGARAWLLSRSENFDQVCLHAQIDPEAVRARARDLERQNWHMPRPGEASPLDEAI